MFLQRSSGNTWSNLSLKDPMAPLSGTEMAQILDLTYFKLSAFTRNMVIGYVNSIGCKVLDTYNIGQLTTWICMLSIASVDKNWRLHSGARYIILNSSASFGGMSWTYCIERSVNHHLFCSSIAVNLPSIWLHLSLVLLVKSPLTLASCWSSTSKSC